MAKKNLCGFEIEYAEDMEFHGGMFHCYGPHTVDGESVVDGNVSRMNFVTIESEDGEAAKVIATCPLFEDAKAIVCAMSVSMSLLDVKNGKSVADEQLRKNGYDVKAIEAKIGELVKSGKPTDEILKYLVEHDDDFRAKKPDVKPTDDSEERW